MVMKCPNKWMAGRVMVREPRWTIGSHYALLRRMLSVCMCMLSMPVCVHGWDKVPVCASHLVDAQ